MKAIILTALLLSGCASLIMGGTMHRIRGEAALDAAAFDTGCSDLEIVSRSGNERFKIAGCGRVYTYICRNDPSQEGYEVAGVRETVKADCRQL
jgi:hypothetical protein